jgi:hypothetical protein
MRVAEVFDGRGPTGDVLINRPQVDQAEMAALTAYLTKAPVALATTKTGEDEMSPGAGLVVPRAYHTDGAWIWPAAVGYYLHRYRLPPQNELLDHIRARRFQLTAVPEDVRQAAAAQMLEELAAAKRVAGGAPAGIGSASAAGPSVGAGIGPGSSGTWAAMGPAPVVQPAEPSLWLPAPAGAAEHAPAEASPPAQEKLVEFVSEAETEGEGFSAAFTAAGNRHAAWVYEQIEAFLGFMPQDAWSVDHESGRYRQAGREFTVSGLGRLDQRGRWTWAWAEPEAWSANPALTERARALRERGGRLGIRELTEPVLELTAVADAEDAETAAEMLAWTAMGVAGARGYLGHTFSGENRLYYLAFDESIPLARPDFAAVAHYVTQGADKFEEDPADCVLGYVEHHGWDWSRSIDGIVVYAGELGTFAVLLAPDGSLTGVSPIR